MATIDVLATGDCEQFVLVRDRAARATVLVALHDTRLGPAHGGIRRWPYADLAAAAADVVALARAMTWKCALAGIAAGGGKAVIVDHAGLDRAAAYRLVGRIVHELGGRFFTGPDVGTTAADLAEVATATPHVAIDPGDGSVDLAAATALGVASALQALAEHLRLPLAGLHVVVQGVGAVGAALCHLLAARGVRLTLGDVVPERAAAVAAACGATVAAPERLRTIPCDVFAPCALGGVLTAAAAEALPARGVCGAANNVFADDRAATVLHARGVLAVPDFVANAGALIAGFTWHRERRAVASERLQAIGATVHALFARAAAANLPPAELALQLARERVARGG